MSSTKVIRAACKCRCCNTSVPTLNNTTTVPNNPGSGFGCDGSQVPPYTRRETSLDCGTDACTGEWDLNLSKGAQSFGNTGTGVINDCLYGWKSVAAKKLVHGRYGFMDDYILDPTKDTFFDGYKVNISLAESVINFTSVITGGGAQVVSVNTTGATTGTAESLRQLTVGGIEDCAGSSQSDGGSSTRTDVTAPNIPSCAGNAVYTDDFNANEATSPSPCSSGTDPEQILIYWNDYVYRVQGVPFGPAEGQARNQGVLQQLCAIDCDRGNISIPVPLTTGYAGPYTGLAAWLAGLSSDTGDLVDDSGNKSRRLIQFSVTNLVVTNTSASGTINFERLSTNTTAESDGSTQVSSFDYKYAFTFSIVLSGQKKYKEFVDAAKALLNQWDMSDKLVYPWQNGGDCRIAPLVTLWEQGGRPGAGYCDTPAPGNLTSLYDGTVKGGPLAGTKGIYAKGWFDFGEDDNNGLIQRWHTGILCNDTECNFYGVYISDYCGVTMATQLVDGFGDSADCNIPVPFSRYFVGSWIAMVPPWATMSCAYLAGDRLAVYAGKWAEKKVPLPSQNFFGPCGAAMQAKTLIDANCQPTATLRWPGAAAMCDATWSTGAPRGDFVRLTNSNGVVTGTDENVVPTTSNPTQTDGVIAIVPPGSPESATWTGPRNRVFTDGYPDILPTQFWWQSIQQGMHDRFFTSNQDKRTSDGMGGCTAIVPAPETPLVEARISAPAGAPFDFSGGDDNAYSKLPGPGTAWGDFSWICMQVWAFSDQFSTQPYTPWPGVGTTPQSATGDQYSTGRTADNPDAGFGPA